MSPDTRVLIGSLVFLPPPSASSACMSYALGDTLPTHTHTPTACKYASEKSLRFSLRVVTFSGVRACASPALANRLHSIQWTLPSGWCVGWPPLHSNIPRHCARIPVTVLFRSSIFRSFVDGFCTFFFLWGCELFDTCNNLSR